MNFYFSNFAARKNFCFYLSLIICSIFLFYKFFQIQIPLDSGDGLTHYFISNAAFKNPLYFLHHWGKPFYTLVTSPFAQFGFKGIIIFNILSFILSNILIFNVIKEIKLSSLFYYVFPIFLIFSLETTHSILSGMTEPLFNLILISSFLFLVKKKWFWFSFFAGLCPFLRSEGQFVVFITLFILIKNLQWKSLLILFIPFIIYSTIGFFVFNDFWWYFNQSPYSYNNSIYGKGNWFDYFYNAPNYLGKHGIFIFGCSIIAVIILVIKKKWNVFFEDYIIFGLIVFTGILMSHVYFWANGLNGSIGLLRLATQGLPLFILVNLILIDRGLQSMELKSTQLISNLLCVLFLAIIVRYYLFRPFLNTQMNEMETNITEACNFLKKKNHNRIYYQYPLVALYFNENPFIPSKKTFEFKCYNLSEQLKKDFKKGDILFWDSHFGPVEGKIPLEILEKYPEMVLINVFNPNQVDNLNPVDQIRLYQFIPKNEQIKGFPKISFKKLYDEKIISFKTEFFDIMKFSKSFDKDEKLEIQIDNDSDKEVFISLDSEMGKVYYTHLLLKGLKTYSFNVSNLKNVKIYFWNHHENLIKMKLKSIQLVKTTFHPIYNKKKNAY